MSPLARLTSFGRLLVLSPIFLAACAGPQGPVGFEGPQGVAGPTGAQGATGAQGPMGDRGLTGLTGADGPQGPQGDPGATGPAGAMGPTGAQGAQGPAGAQGVPGAQGPAGLGLDKSKMYEVTASAYLPANGLGGVSAACHDVNDVLVSGGCEADPAWAKLVTSRAGNIADTTKPSGWSCSATNSSASTAISVSAYAYCLAVP